jgi:hypothetical protein
VYTRISKYESWIRNTIATYKTEHPDAASSAPAPVVSSPAASPSSTGGPLSNTDLANKYCYKKTQFKYNLTSDQGSVSKITLVEPAGAFVDDPGITNFSSLLQSRTALDTCRFTTSSGGIMALYSVAEAGHTTADPRVSYYLESPDGKVAKAEAKTETRYRFENCNNTGAGDPMTAEYSLTTQQFSMSSSMVSYSGVKADRPTGTLVEEMMACGSGAYEIRFFMSNGEMWGRLIPGANMPYIWLKMAMAASPLPKLRLASTSATEGRLDVVNSTASDIYTWRLTCPFAFSLRDTAGKNYVATAAGGSSHVVQFNFPGDNNGYIVAGKYLSFTLSTGSSQTIEGIRKQSCSINNSAIRFE